MDISEQLGSTTTQEEIEPFLEVTTELVQKRRSQGRIIWDRFIRNRAAVVGAVALLLLVLFCFARPLSLDAQPRFGQCPECIFNVGGSYPGPSLWHR